MALDGEDAAIAEGRIVFTDPTRTEDEFTALIGRFGTLVYLLSELAGATASSHEKEPVFL